MSVRIPYGLKQGSAVHVSSVASGLACACVCLNCGGDLIARKGNQREDHFAHRSGLECAGAVEGVLHRLAKDLVCSLSQFEVPEYVWQRSRCPPFGQVVQHKKQLTRAGKIRVLRAFPEFRMPPDFIPDIVLFAESAVHEPKPLFVEIVVSNRIHKLKHRRIRRFGVPTLEIHLGPADLALSLNELRDKLQGLSPAKRWSFHPAQIECEKAFVAEYRRRRREARLAFMSENPTNHNQALRNLRRSQKKSGPTDATSFFESERALRRFYAKHSRYPSLEETRAALRSK